MSPATNRRALKACDVVAKDGREDDARHAGLPARDPGEEGQLLAVQGAAALDHRGGKHTESQFGALARGRHLVYAL